jgi:hypothetical protein
LQTTHIKQAKDIDTESPAANQDGRGFPNSNLSTKPSFYKNCKNTCLKATPKHEANSKNLFLSMKQTTQGMFLLFHCSLVLFYFNKVAQLKV